MGASSSHVTRSSAVRLGSSWPGWLGTAGDRWGPLGTAGDRWGSLGIAGDRWGSLGNAGVTAGCSGLLRVAAGCRRLLRVAAGCCGLLRTAHTEARWQCLDRAYITYTDTRRYEACSIRAKRRIWLLCPCGQNGLRVAHRPPQRLWEQPHKSTRPFLH